MQVKRSSDSICWKEGESSIALTPERSKERNEHSENRGGRLFKLKMKWDALQVHNVTLFSFIQINNSVKSVSIHGNYSRTPTKCHPIKLALDFLIFCAGVQFYVGRSLLLNPILCLGIFNKSSAAIITLIKSSFGNVFQSFKVDGSRSAWKEAESKWLGFIKSGPLDWTSFTNTKCECVQNVFMWSHFQKCFISFKP